MMSHDSLFKVFFLWMMKIFFGGDSMYRLEIAKGQSAVWLNFLMSDAIMY